MDANCRMFIDTVAFLPIITRSCAIGHNGENNDDRLGSQQ